MTLRAGAAAVEITPKGPGPVALFGYPHVPRISEGVHDPLLAAALWLSDGERSAVLMALDLLLLDPPAARALRRAVAEALQTPEQCVFISCTHTHSGPISGTIVSWSRDPTVPRPDAAYQEWLIGQAVCAARQAARSAVPAGLAWTTADGRGVGGNRHRADGPTDPEAGVLAVRSLGDDRVFALAVVYGMHPTVLHEDSRLVSADFPHYVRRHLQERFGDPLTVLYHTGPCGNQSPRHFAAGQTFSEAERLGRKLGQAVAESVARLRKTDFLDACAPSGRLDSLALPRRSLPSVAEAERIVAECRRRHRRLEADAAPRADVRTAECAVFGAESTLTLATLETQGEIDRVLDECGPAEVHVLRIGDAQLVGFPAELFVEYGLELKRRHAGRVFPVSLVGGHVHGYIVTSQAADQYEGMNAVFDGPASGRLLLQKALEMLAERR